MEKKIEFVFDEKEINVIYLGLLELPAKMSLSVIDKIKDRVEKFNETLESEKEEKN